MAGFATFSTTASVNVTVNGISIAEGCPAGNVNDALRNILAEGKQLSDIVGALNVTGLMSKAGGAFTGPITQTGAGGYLYHAAAAQSQGPIYTQLVATALPSSPVEGTVVLQY
jgi:hypothetical protein